jgi:hypothetical protein
VSFAAILLCVASQRVFIVVVYFVMTQSGNFWLDSDTWNHNPEDTGFINQLPSINFHKSPIQSDFSKQ